MQIAGKTIRPVPIILALAAAIFYLPFLNGVHLFDWDEINFAEIAREMVVTGDWLRPQINYEFFTEKPPLFMWLQAVCFSLFGISDGAARLPNALAGIVTLPLLYELGRRIHGHKVGLWWAIAYFGSVLPALYFRSGIIDPIFNLFIFLGIYQLIQFHWKYSGLIENPSRKIKHLLFAGIFTGLAILVKGPVALLITGAVIIMYVLFQGFRFVIPILHLMFYIGVVLGVTALWFGALWMVTGPDFMVEFTIRQWELFSTPDAGHSGFLGYHFVVLLFGVFPASVFFIKGAFIRQSVTDPKQRDFTIWMKILFFVVLILFTVVETKIVHYSSLAYFPLTYIAAICLAKLSDKEISLTTPYRSLLAFLFAVFIIVTAALPYLGRNIEMLKGLAKNDPFAVENFEADVSWPLYTFASSAILLAILIFFFLKINNSPRTALLTLFGGMGVWVWVTLVLFIGRVEGYTQRASIEFWEDKKQEEAYFVTYGYKSYAHYWYGRIQPHQNLSATNREWLLRGEIDRPVYLACRTYNKGEVVVELPHFEFLYQKNGFHFYKREP